MACCSRGVQARERQRLFVRRLGLVVGSSHARGRTRRASPRLIRLDTAGGCHGACADWGMNRTNRKPSSQSRSKQRVAVIAERAAVTRGSPTATEALLWDRIRGRQLGVVFRRQVPLLGRFIADFYAPAQRLVIEVDGVYHGERARADARRDAALERAGYRVVRLETSLIARDIRVPSRSSARRSSLKSGVGPSAAEGPTSRSRATRVANVGGHSPVGSGLFRCYARRPMPAPRKKDRYAKELAQRLKTIAKTRPEKSTRSSAGSSHLRWRGRLFTGQPRALLDVWAACSSSQRSALCLVHVCDRWILRSGRNGLEGRRAGRGVSFRGTRATRPQERNQQ